MKLFAVCAPGLEPFTSQELEELRLSLSPPGEKKHAEERGGVELEGSLIDVYRCNLHLRTASRLLVRLGSFYSIGFPELRRKAGNLPWEDYLKAGKPVAIRVTCHQSRLYHQQAVAERIAGAVSDRLKYSVIVEKCSEEIEKDFSTGNPSSPPFNKGGMGGFQTYSQRRMPQLIVVRLVNDHCTISIDSSGELLYRRGYRLATTKAPLRETLAAGMILASGWDRISPLLDPFCGSGTIVIEAALLARQIPPGRGRHFAFMDWPSFKEKAWDALLCDQTPGIQAPLPRIVASDRDAGAIRAAKANADRAGVPDCIEFSCHAVSSMDPPPGPGWVVTNPPYGVRTESNKDLRNLYAQFGNVVRARCPRWEVTILCNSSQLLHSTGLDLDESIPLMTGGIKVRLVSGRIYPV
jgi:putative N6-adenine-specific DNA methylase